MFSGIIDLIDRNTFNSEDQFIFPEGEKHRGRFERSFSEIGAMVIGGATVGGARGLYTGLTDATIKELPTVSIQRTQILNHVTKSGANLSQTAGSIGLLYALADFAIHKLRGGADDELNTVTAATATGCLYKSPGRTVYFIPYRFINHSASLLLSSTIVAFRSIHCIFHTGVIHSLPVPYPPL
ncbi:unnamed protein product [Echinostoma caproni]|uniref:Mitochondrial import inner membrane translocase subunit Tim23 n=1 Tax=Echinostoma caproni TaxID=27848 RepID=A0A3P8HX91_9TREM|nr:unnamed protein product [Echinostoma caproni]